MAKVFYAGILFFTVSLLVKIKIKLKSKKDGPNCRLLKCNNIAISLFTDNSAHPFAGKESRK